MIPGIMTALACIKNIHQTQSSITNIVQHDSGKRLFWKSGGRKGHLGRTKPARRIFLLLLLLVPSPSLTSAPPLLRFSLLILSFIFRRIRRQHSFASCFCFYTPLRTRHSFRGPLHSFGGFLCPVFADVFPPPGTLSTFDHPTCWQS